MYIRFSILAAAVALVPHAVFGQTPASPFDRFPQLISRLKDPAVLEELELEDYQSDEVKRLDAARSQALGAMFGQIRAAPQEHRRAIFDSHQETIRELDRELEKVLFPKQMERLKQIELQYSVRAGTASAGLTDKRLVEALGLTESQQEKIAAEVAELEAKLKARLEELRKEMLLNSA